MLKVNQKSINTLTIKKLCDISDLSVRIVCVNMLI